MFNIITDTEVATAQGLTCVFVVLFSDLLKKLDGFNIENKVDNFLPMLT